MAMLWGWSPAADWCSGCACPSPCHRRAAEGAGGAERGRHLNGRIAVGWLIVEDLAMVLVLVLLSALAGMLGGNVPGGGHGAPEHGLLPTLAITRSRSRPSGRPSRFRRAAGAAPDPAPGGAHRLPRAVHAGDTAVSVGIAFGAAELFGVSPALGRSSPAWC
ncbi:MAG: hypothetical protein IPN24_20665 [Betaproteobacteria bacterium]|nr:hypothetical protein [Betaproteobacteria bacterium]